MASSSRARGKELGSGQDRNLAEPLCHALPCQQWQLLQLLSAPWRDKAHCQEVLLKVNPSTGVLHGKDD